jgi:hypothetical protein
MKFKDPGWPGRLQRVVGRRRERLIRLRPERALEAARLISRRKCLQAKQRWFREAEGRICGDSKGEVDGAFNGRGTEVVHSLLTEVQGSVISNAAATPTTQLRKEERATGGGVIEVNRGERREGVVFDGIHVRCRKAVDEYLEAKTARSKRQVGDFDRDTAR